MSESIVIDVRNLSKQFNDILAVDNLSFTVFERDIYGFLGPNGSGKSTTIRMLLSLIKPDSGKVSIFGLPMPSRRMEVLTQTGSFIEKPDFYEHLSAFKNMEVFSWYSGISPNREKIQEILELVGLSNRMNHKVKTYSKGMKQRLGIAQALIHNPKLLILDEPASGLDPGGMRDIRELIRFLNREKNITIFLSSHNLLEIEQIAHRMLVISRGSRVVEGEVSQLLGEFSFFTTFRLTDSLRAKELVKQHHAIDEVLVEGNLLKVKCPRSEISRINRTLVEQGIDVESIRVEHNLEDYFLMIT